MDTSDFVDLTLNKKMLESLKRHLHIYSFLYYDSNACYDEVYGYDNDILIFYISKLKMSSIDSFLVKKEIVDDLVDFVKKHDSALKKGILVHIDNKVMVIEFYSDDTAYVDSKCKCKFACECPVDDTSSCDSDNNDSDSDSDSDNNDSDSDNNDSDNNDSDGSELEDIQNLDLNQDLDLELEYLISDNVLGKDINLNSSESEKQHFIDTIYSKKN